LAGPLIVMFPAAGRLDLCARELISQGGRGLACGVMAETDVILTPDQRVRVFISSTPEELAAERAAARRARQGGPRWAFLHGR
jgi:hypothetical protein